MKKEDKLKPLTIQIPTSLHIDVKTLASSKGLKLREFVMEVFIKELKKEGMR
ncbi:hypothetical protein [Romboutsia weinsteinii]|uniref:hypothetical protein n=1 Tax=Romboutsia weinsteinii TaxID=2020949 RepID=UPI001313E978|nr:hypothetical protein [Romboutsia weinsteinii]